MEKVCVLGTGSWGSALGLTLAKKGYEVSMWTLNEEQAKRINKTRENIDYLPGVLFPNNMTVTISLEEAVLNSIIIVLAVPSQAIRSVCNQIKPFIKDEQIIVDVAKGLEKGTGLRLSEVVEEELPNNPYVTLSGPSHAEEVARDIPTTVVVASTNLEVAQKVQEIFMGPKFRVYTNPDIVGVELGGALKNIIAFCAGVAAGIGLGDNSFAALITRGLKEISRLGIKLGGELETFYGLSGLGDLIVTCLSEHSRNRKAGKLIGQGKTLEETKKEVGMVIESIDNIDVAYQLGKINNIEMPIVNAVYEVLYNKLDPQEAVKNLMTRNKKME